MKVFVLGTGRCGSVTLAKALQHATNFRTVHEPQIHSRQDLHFPDQFIAISPHFSWMLAPLYRANPEPDNVWVHLRRARDEVVASWTRRGHNRGPGRWMPLSMRLDPAKVTDKQWRVGAELCHESMVGQIEAFLQVRALDGGNVEYMNLPNLARDLARLWSRIGATGPLGAAIAETKLHHNAS